MLPGRRIRGTEKFRDLTKTTQHRQYHWYLDFYTSAVKCYIPELEPPGAPAPQLPRPHRDPESVPPGTHSARALLPLPAPTPGLGWPVPSRAVPAAPSVQFGRF